MMLTENTQCEVVRRRCGGWLAYSCRSQPLRIGVTGRTEAEVVEQYHEALTQWRRNIATDLKRGSIG